MYSTESTKLHNYTKQNKEKLYQTRQIYSCNYIHSRIQLNALSWSSCARLRLRLLPYVQNRKCTMYQTPAVEPSVVTFRLTIQKQINTKMKATQTKIWKSQRGINVRQGLILILICVDTGYKTRENRYIALSLIVRFLINYKMPSNAQNHRQLSNINTQKIHVTRASVWLAIHIAYTLHKELLPLPYDKTNH